MPEEKHRINQRIRCREVRLVDQDGEMLGIMSPEQALSIARQRSLDLVEIAPTAQPPVCRLMDYGRFKYETSKKDRESRANRKTVELREVKMRPKIDEHDYQVKRRTVERLLQDGDRVKVTMRFRGREVVHSNLAMQLLKRIYEDVQSQAVILSAPIFEGKTMSMVLAPNPQTAAKAASAQAAEEGGDEAAPPAAEPQA